MDWQSDRLGAAARGENPTVLARMSTGWAVIGDTQHLPGYSLLLYAGKADHLTDLPRAERAAFLMDMSILGEAVQHACQAADPDFLRVNYEILGNTWHHLHGHVHARYAWEAEPLRAGPVWRYEDRKHPKYQLSTEHDALRAAIAATLTTLLQTAA